MPLNPQPDGGLGFLARLLTRPPVPGSISRLESLLLEAQVDLVPGGWVEVSWSAWLSAAEAYWEGLSEVDQRIVGTPRDILNRWALNGSYFLEFEESRDLLRIHSSDLPSQGDQSS